MNKEYELLIFDWDGTLMDSGQKIINCFQAAVKEVDFDPISDNQIRDIIGLGLEEAIEELFPEHDQRTRDNFLDLYRNYFLHIDNTETPMFPGVIEGIKKLHLQNHVLAVATGKARQGLNRVLDGHELEDIFTVTRCGDETISKPHPLMLEQILQHTGIEKSRALMIGDSTFDLRMAANAGMDSLAVSYGVQTCDRLLECNPMGCIHEFSEIHQWLN